MRGTASKKAAAVLHLSPYTIETHRTNLMQKLGLHNTAEIVLYARSQWHHYTLKRRRRIIDLDTSRRD